ncbi:elongin-A isoform X1 [Latimeria chalumnae]|uniref:elongin-A isoform X1 n=1 Tax=Latimeria chalumnae TaxID=7897 RepID=UPI0006D90A3A|nr:PREDICTED: transcription elongation factor B polypeptide 3 [Latimeria chalumnae]|eukprot:XP_014353952.1 PREDICTED: transcription elongation factor B polypeptide 3 [Latimeria chalumnae]
MPITKMAESVVDVVEKLQSRLFDGQEPKKLLKTLKRLAELPITVDILVETGIGKTVNGLRKHELVGEFAKSLVTKWKKLVPQEAERSTNESEEADHRDQEKKVSRKRHRDPSPEEEGSYRPTFQPSPDYPYSQNYRQSPNAKYKTLSEGNQLHKPSSLSSRAQPATSRDERDRWSRASPEQDFEGGYSDDGGGYSPPQPESSHEQYRELYLASERTEKGRGRDRDSSGDKVEKGREKERARTSREAQHKEKHHYSSRGEESKSAFSPGQEKLHKFPSKEQRRERDRPGGGGSGKERHQGSDVAEHRPKKERHKDGALASGSSREKAKPLFEEALDQSVIKKKHKDAEKVKPKPSSDKQKDSSEKSKEKSSSTKGKQDGKSKSSEQERPSGGFSKPAGEAEKEDLYEQPTMSFESYLSYDQPKKKKKKVGKPSPPVPEKGKDSSSQNGSASASRSSEPSYTETPPSKKVKEGSENQQSVKKRRRIVIDEVPTLPDIPLPPIQPNYRPLPSVDLMPLSPQKRKAVLPVIHEEESTGFTGRRLNSKMQVYSGSKMAYLPKMMSLYDQCIRVLQNNIDSIHEVGGVPFDILEPVLERCTPDQLYHIEDCNPVFVEDTEELWMKHCKRDFRSQEPQEYETWREMYLRLHDEREHRLRLLTQNISSAHASKPKGRQVKMAFVNTEVKPPRDVRRRQEKFGTGAAVVPERPRVKSVFNVGNSSASGESRPHSGPSTSSGGITSSSSSVSLSPVPSHDPRKPPVKKIAPMMAKTIKAFKNRFSRR